MCFCDVLRTKDQLHNVVVRTACIWFAAVNRIRDIFRVMSLLCNGCSKAQEMTSRFHVHNTGVGCNTNSHQPGGTVVFLVLYHY